MKQECFADDMHYQVAAHCSNCGYHGNVTLEKGVDKPRTTTCPVCKCYTLHTRWA